jgi:hypothetical protein
MAGVDTENAHCEGAYRAVHMFWRVRVLAGDICLVYSEVTIFWLEITPVK